MQVSESILCGWMLWFCIDFIFYIFIIVFLFINIYYIINRSYEHKSFFMKKIFLLWSLIVVVSTFTTGCSDDDTIINNTDNNKVASMTFASVADDRAWASLAVFLDQPHNTWQIEEWSVTSYTIWYEASTSDNSWAKVVIPGNYFTEIHYQGGSDSAEYGPNNTVTIKTPQGFISQWTTNSALYPLLDITQVRQVQIEFMFKVKGKWYKTAKNTYKSTDAPDTFWV